MKTKKKAAYAAPETEILELRLETIVATSTQMPGGGLGLVEPGDPFNNFDPQSW